MLNVKWGIIKKGPVESSQACLPSPAVQMKLPVTTGTACAVVCVRIGKVQFGVAGELQAFAGLVIDEKQPGAGIDREIAERIEHAVTVVVGDAERALVEDLYKTRVAAPVADIDVVVVVAAADKKRVDAGNPALQCIGEMHACFGGRIGLPCGGRHCYFAPLNVSRAKRKTFLHLHLQTGTVRREGYRAVHFQPPARGQLDEQQTDAGVPGHIGPENIIFSRHQMFRMQPHRLRRFGLHKTGLAREHRYPDVLLLIHARGEHERLFIDKFQCAVGNLVGNEPAVPTGDLRLAGQGLDFQLAGMKWVAFHMQGWENTAAKGWRPQVSELECNDLIAFFLQLYKAGQARSAGHGIG